MLANALPPSKADIHSFIGKSVNYIKKYDTQKLHLCSTTVTDGPLRKSRVLRLHRDKDKIDMQLYI